MALQLLIGCDQSQFGARRGGSCWGIAFLFCKNALASDPVTGTHDLLKDPQRAELTEDLMKAQDAIHQQAGPLYLRDSGNTPISDLDAPEGFANQNLVIQLRHNAIKELASHHGIRCIGTLSSFFEGNQTRLIKHLVELASKAGIAAVQMDLQQPAGHAVALYLREDQLYFFDPNFGLYQATNKSTAVGELVERFQDYRFSFGHVLLKK